MSPYCKIRNEYGLFEIIESDDTHLAFTTCANGQAVSIDMSWQDVEAVRSTLEWWQTR